MGPCVLSRSLCSRSYHSPLWQIRLGRPAFNSLLTRYVAANSFELKGRPTEPGGTGLLQPHGHDIVKECLTKESLADVMEVS